MQTSLWWVYMTNYSEVQEALNSLTQDDDGTPSLPLVPSCLRFLTDLFAFLVFAMLFNDGRQDFKFYLLSEATKEALATLYKPSESTANSNLGALLNGKWDDIDAKERERDLFVPLLKAFQGACTQYETQLGTDEHAHFLINPAKVDEVRSICLPPCPILFMFLTGIVSFA